MRQYEFSEQDLEILRDGVLALMENTNKAFNLVQSEQAKQEINREWRQYNTLLTKICE